MAQEKYVPGGGSSHFMFLVLAVKEILSDDEVRNTSIEYAYHD